MELILIPFFLTLFIFFGIYHPTYFIILYILLSSKFLGFFDLELVSVQFFGYGIFTVLIHLIALAILPIKTNLTINLKLRVEYFFWILFFTILFFHGLIYPSLMGYSSIFLSLVAGKHFLIFFVLFYMIAKKDQINSLSVTNIIKFIGIYLSITLIIFSLTGISPPFYENKTDMMGASIGILEVYHLTFISLGLFLFLGDHLQNISVTFLNRWLTYSILLLGLFLGSHRSIFLMSFLIFLFLKLMFNNKYFDRINKPKLLAIFLLFLIPIFIPLFSSFLQNSENWDMALISRLYYDTFRIDLIMEQPLFGYGFIHPSSSLMSQININFSNIYMEKLHTIDSGYIDLLIRFGILGLVLYLSPLLYFISKIIIFNRNYSFNQFILALFIFQYFLVNIVWSVFSFDLGLVPLVIALFLIFNNKKVKLQNDTHQLYA